MSPRTLVKSCAQVLATSQPCYLLTSLSMLLQGLLTGMQQQGSSKT